MAELATLARPYAEALFKAVGAADALAVAEQVAELDPAYHRDVFVRDPDIARCR